MAIGSESESDVVLTNNSSFSEHFHNVNNSRWQNHSQVEIIVPPGSLIRFFMIFS